jgi:hypothetical protein
VERPIFSQEELIEYLCVRVLVRVRCVRCAVRASDPFDVTSLNAYAHEQGRSAELQCLGISPRSSGREEYSNPPPFFHLSCPATKASDS